MTIPIRFVPDVWGDDCKPGDAQWISSGGEGITNTATGEPVPLRENASLAFRCPGCGKLGSVNVRPAPADRHSWDFDGNLEAPTLSPSIHCVGCCRWHGHLRAGIFASV